MTLNVKPATSVRRPSVCLSGVTTAGFVVASSVPSALLISFLLQETLRMRAGCACATIVSVVNAAHVLTLQQLQFLTVHGWLITANCLVGLVSDIYHD